MRDVWYIGKDFVYFKVVGWPVFKNKEKLRICECECWKIFHRASRFFLKHKRCKDCKSKSLRENPPNKTHGMSKIPEYKVRAEAKARCSNPQKKFFQHYGWRWISMCEERRSSFESFFAHMWPRPSDSHSIDRIDVNKWYLPWNCRWATPEEQSLNKVKTLYYNWKTLMARSKEVWINYRTLKYRMEKLSMSLEEAISQENRYDRKFLGKTVRERVNIFKINASSFYYMSNKLWWHKEAIEYYKKKV